MLTAHGSIDSAVAAIRGGAADFLGKPTDFELLRAALERILERRRLARANRAYEEREAERADPFLDEIGEIAPEVQARLLHFLETGEFERVGGTKTLKVDCRIVAATNRDLEAAIKAGAFREDLYWRLNVIALHMPPLRERRAEIP